MFYEVAYFCDEFVVVCAFVCCFEYVYPEENGGKVVVEDV